MVSTKYKGQQQEGQPEDILPLKLQSSEPGDRPAPPVPTWPQLGPHLLLRL